MISTVPEQQQPQPPQQQQPPQPQPQQQPPEQGREYYMKECVPLYKATIKGNWGDAEALLNGNQDLVRSGITENQDTALHIAAMAQSTKFVENLVNIMSDGDLRLRNRDGNTALCLAAIAGNVEMVEVMVANNREGLLIIRGSKDMDMMPIHLAALYGKHAMVNYLYEKVRVMIDDWTDDDRNMLFLKCIEVDLFDVALKIFNDNKGIDQFPQDQYVWEVLHLLARKPYAFNDIKPNIIQKSINLIFEVLNMKLRLGEKKNEATQLLGDVWGKIMVNQNNIDVIPKGPMMNNTGVETYPSRPFVATEMGNISFLLELIYQYPDLIWKKDDNGQTIFHVAVSHRRESIYRLLYEIGSMKDLITPLVDNEGNNMLHLVGMEAKKNPYENLLTAPFQMQREILWFKEVKGMIPPSYREAENNAGQTPSELFGENHKDLVSKSNKWIKGTTNQCMVAAVLIATIGFSGAFTIPGGYNQLNGFPQFLKDGHLIAFVVFDAISFILSSISVLMFLSIVISRYAQTDFLESLPQKLTIALSALFLSIISMTVAFGVNFFILYNNKYMVVPLLIGAFATTASIFYFKMLYPLLVDVFGSRYSSKYLFNPKKNKLFYQNPKV